MRTACYKPIFSDGLVYFLHFFHSDRIFNVFSRFLKVDSPYRPSSFEFIDSQPYSIISVFSDQFPPYRLHFMFNFNFCTFINTDVSNKPVSGETAISFTRCLSAKEFFVGYIMDDGLFSFICSDSIVFSQWEEETGHYVIDYARLGSGKMVGHGLYSGEPVKGIILHNMNKEQADVYLEFLTFLFYDRKPETFFPYDKLFAGRFTKAGCDCFYLHEYIPRSQGKKRDFLMRKVDNLLYRFKEGFNAWKVEMSGSHNPGKGGATPGLVARLLALAIETEGIITDRYKTVILPIPASTREKHEKRFREFFRLLAGWLDVIDGFDMIEVLRDRPAGAARGGMPVQDNIRLKNDGETLCGKHIILIDDMYASGRSFESMVHYLSTTDPASVKGVFLCRSVSPEK